MRCRAELLALLVYVTLDLSLPAMPGAFVFEPADSVESAGGAATAAVSFTGFALTTITAISSVTASAVVIRMPRLEERRERRNDRMPLANPMETSLGSPIANPVSPGLK